MIEDIVNRIMDKHLKANPIAEGILGGYVEFPYTPKEQLDQLNKIKNLLNDVQKKYGNFTALFLANSIEENFRSFRGQFEKLIEMTNEYERDEWNEIIGVLKINKGYGIRFLELCSAVKDYNRNIRFSLYDCLEFYVTKEIGEDVMVRIINRIEEGGFRESIINRLSLPDLKETINAYSGKSVYLVSRPLLDRVFSSFLSDSFISNSANNFRKENVMKTIKKYEEIGKSNLLESLCGVIASLESDFSIDRTVQVYETFIDNYDENVFETIESMAANHTPGLVTAIEVLIMYKDVPQVAETISKHWYDAPAFSYKRLLNKDLFEIIKNSNVEDIHSIWRGNYGKHLSAIEDKEFLKEITFKELKVIEPSYNLIINIHKDRSKYHEKLISSFYEEMNRAISQGNDYKSKIKRLNEYCNQVKRQLMNNSEELMVVVDE